MLTLEEAFKEDEMRSLSRNSFSVYDKSLAEAWILLIAFFSSLDGLMGAVPVPVLDVSTIS